MCVPLYVFLSDNQIIEYRKLTFDLWVFFCDKGLWRSLKRDWNLLMADRGNCINIQKTNSYTWKTNQEPPKENNKHDGVSRKSIFQPEFLQIYMEKYAYSEQ